MNGEGKTMLNRRIWFPLVLVGVLLLGAAGGVLAAQGLQVTQTSVEQEAALPASPAKASPTTTTTVATTSTTTITSTTVPAEPAFDFVAFQRAYDDGYGWGYQLGLVKGEIPDVVTEMYDSNNPEDFGYATGYIDGWQVAATIAGAEETGTEPTPAPALATASATASAPAPTVLDRGYDQGKSDGETAGKADGQLGIWSANIYVLGQGPEYTRGFYEAYDWWYSWALSASSRSIDWGSVTDVDTSQTPASGVTSISRDG